MARYKYDSKEQSYIATIDNNNNYPSESFAQLLNDYIDEHID